MLREFLQSISHVKLAQVRSFWKKFRVEKTSPNFFIHPVLKKKAKGQSKIFLIHDKNLSINLARYSFENICLNSDNFLRKRELARNFEADLLPWNILKNIFQVNFFQDESKIYQKDKSIREFLHFKQHLDSEGNMIIKLISLSPNSPRLFSQKSV